MCEALKTGGGHLASGAYLGNGATHVVCQPQAAVKWLAMGETFAQNVAIWLYTMSPSAALVYM